MSYQVSASIVLYKNDKTVFKTIECILKTKLTIVLYLIDNSPSNILKSELAEFINLPQVEYIFNNKNIGFGAAHNIAIKKCLQASQYHLVINPDICFDEGVIENLYSYMEQNVQVGHIMPKILYPNGKTQYVAKLLPTPFDLLVRRFLPSNILQKQQDRFELKISGHDKIFQAPYLSGCFMFLRTHALQKVGIFDERFFMYPEDIDLTRRIHSKFQTIYYPFVQVYHEHGQGSYKNFKMLWIHTSNMIKYFNKWGWFFDKERKTVNKKTMQQFN